MLGGLSAKPEVIRRRDERVVRCSCTASFGDEIAQFEKYPTSADGRLAKIK
jgi:acetone carboxylase gamma subunit